MTVGYLAIGGLFSDKEYVRELRKHKLADEERDSTLILRGHRWMTATT
jgi:hypothetical protein